MNFMQSAITLGLFKVGITQATLKQKTTNGIFATIVELKK